MTLEGEFACEGDLSLSGRFIRCLQPKNAGECAEIRCRNIRLHAVKRRVIEEVGDRGHEGERHTLRDGEGLVYAEVLNDKVLSFEAVRAGGAVAAGGWEGEGRLVPPLRVRTIGGDGVADQVGQAAAE